MEVKTKNISDDKNKNINTLINKLANSNDIQSYKDKLFKLIEENNKRMMISVKNDKKYHLLLTRTYYLNEFDKIEKIINTEELLDQKCNLSHKKYLQLLSYLNVLFCLEDFYIYKSDCFRSLQLKSKIINIIKNFIINKIG